MANYISGTLAVLPIHADGSLAPIFDLFKPPGSPDTDGVHLYVKQGVSHPHHAPLDPTGRCIVVPDLGVNKVFVYSQDITGGKLIINDPAFGKSPEGSCQSHIDFHHTQPYAFVSSELDSKVVALKIRGNTCSEVCSPFG